MREWTKIQNLGEGRTRALFGMDVSVEEKIDGRLLSVSVDEEGRMEAASRRNSVDPERPSIFSDSFNHLRSVRQYMMPGDTHFFEFRNRVDSHHCVYQRVPAHGLILLDVCSESGAWQNLSAKCDTASVLEVEHSYITYLGAGWHINSLLEMIEQESFLGGKREGVVVKSMDTGNRLLGKLVRDEYRESFIADWSGRDDSASLASSMSVAFATDIRFDKVAQKMADAGELRHHPSDIGAVTRAVWDDVAEEEAERLNELSPKQVKHIRDDINRRVALWYKARFDSLTAAS